VVRERSAKPLCVGSIPTRASNLFVELFDSESLTLLTARSFYISGNTAVGGSGTDKKRTKKQWIIQRLETIPESHGCCY
jgi:hypothetical protein